MFLQTERLILRRFRQEDLADFAAFAADPEMCRMMGRDLIADESSARPTFLWLKDHEERGYAMVLRETGRVMGNLTVTRAPESIVRRPELSGKQGCSLSFSVSRAYQRRGLMQEALTAVLHRLFREEGMDYVHCGYLHFNTASRALQEKLGFREAERVRFAMEGEEVEAVENLLTAGEYFAGG